MPRLQYIVGSRRTLCWPPRARRRVLDSFLDGRGHEHFKGNPRCYLLSGVLVVVLVHASI